VLVRIPDYFIQMDAAIMFINGVMDQDVKLHLPTGNKRSPDLFHVEFLAKFKKSQRPACASVTKPTLT
jgi:hypothetical protein